GNSEQVQPIRSFRCSESDHSKLRVGEPATNTRLGFGGVPPQMGTGISLLLDTCTLRFGLVKAGAIGREGEVLILPPLPCTLFFRYALQDIHLPRAMRSDAGAGEKSRSHSDSRPVL